jgi:hypothetical protein
MNEGKVKITMYFVWSALGCQAHAIKAADGNEGLHTFGAEAISLLFLAIGCHPVSAQILFVETRNEKCRQKVSSQRDQQPTHPSNPPNQPTSQNKLRRPGSKESTKAQASKETFFRPNLSFIDAFRCRGYDWIKPAHA